MIYKTEPVKVFLNGKYSNIFTLIDTEDVDLVNQYKWYLSTAGYAVTTYHKSGCSKMDPNRNVNQSLARLILNNPDGVVDHIDRNRLNNTKSNLRVVDYKINSWNTKQKVNPTTGYIGIYASKVGTFYALVSGKHIGTYSSAELAAKARDLYIINQRGLDHARLNLNFDISDLPLEVTRMSVSDLRGVSFSRTRKARCKWRVVYKKKHYGWFLTEEEARSTLKLIKENESKKSRII